jgi:Na+-driven multidrug efflux pump
LCVATFIIAMSVIYCVDPWIIRLFIDGVYYHDWTLKDAVGRLKDDFVLILFLWVLVCFIAGWVVTHFPNRKKPMKCYLSA